MFLEVALLYGFFGILLLLGINHKGQQVSHVESCALVVIVFALGAIFAAVPYPLLVANLPYRLALFEGMSGFTTTGATIFNRVEDLPQALVLWRSLTAWFGGFIFLIAVLLVLGPARMGGLPWGQKGMVEMGGENLTNRIKDLFVTVLPIYAGLTCVCFTLSTLLTDNLPLFDVLNLSLTTVATAGFMPIDGNMSFYGSRTLEFVLALVMLISATSIFWQRQILRHPRLILNSNAEVRWLLYLVGFLSVFAGFLLFAAPYGLSFSGAMLESFFTVISIISTTGYSLRSGDELVLTLPLMLTLTLVGGCAFSTAGGLKLYRFAALAIQAGRELQKLLYPHGVRTSQIGQVFYDMQIMKAVWSGFAAFLLLIVGVTLILSANMPDFEAALLLAISAIANAGPIYPGQWAQGEPWPDYFQLHPLSHYTLIIAMFLGRLELIVVLTLLNLRYWRT